MARIASGVTPIKYYVLNLGENQKNLKTLHLRVYNEAEVLLFSPYYTRHRLKPFFIFRSRTSVQKSHPLSYRALILTGALALCVSLAALLVSVRGCGKTGKPRILASAGAARMRGFPVLPNPFTL